jgi:hypothetical protein
MARRMTMSLPGHRRADLLVHGGFRSTVYLVKPITARGDDWLAKNIDPSAQRLGPAVAVEHRFIRDIIEGAVDDGLGVERW